jgi:NUMOD4 motif
MTETWRDIPNWSGYYQASSEGRVRSLDRVIIRRNGVKYRAKGRIRRPQRHRPGWGLAVTLARCGPAGTFIFKGWWRPRSATR